MKTNLILAAMAATIAFTSCETVDLTDNMNNNEEPTVTTKNTKKVTFKLKGTNVSVESTTRAALVADERNLTDLYIIDYVNGIPVQILHQVSTQPDFAEPTLILTYGDHTLRFVATRSTNPQVLKADGTAFALTDGTAQAIVGTTYPTLLTSAKTSDTFTGTLTMTASATSATSRVVTLDRAVARLNMLMSDEVPSDADKLTVEIADSYDALNFQTYVMTKRQDHHFEVSLSSIRGKSNQSVLVYTLAPVDEWQSSVSVNTLRSNGTTISSFTLDDVPLLRNRTTTIEGDYFNRTDAFSFTINDTWEESYKYQI